MKDYRILIVEFTNLNILQKFYNIEFSLHQKFINRNIRINYKKSSINQITLIGFDGNIKYYTNKFTITEINRIFQLIDKMPMRLSNNYIYNKYNMLCGLPNEQQVNHCFNDATHQTCCLLGYKARKYSDDSGNPIGKVSEDMFKQQFDRLPDNNDLTPWCTCIGSQVCSYYADKFNDGTHIKFINNKGTIIYNLLSECEKNIVEKYKFFKHMTPGVNNNNKDISRNCQYSSFNL